MVLMIFSCSRAAVGAHPATRCNSNHYVKTSPRFRRSGRDERWEQLKRGKNETVCRSESGRCHRSDFYSVDSGYDRARGVTASAQAFRPARVFLCAVADAGANFPFSGVRTDCCDGLDDFSAPPSIGDMRLITKYSRQHQRRRFIFGRCTQGIWSGRGHAKLG